MQIIFHILFSIFITFILQLIFHELGHLFGGLLTGWQLVYMQIYKMVVVKGKKRPVIKTLNTANYQCVMSPKRVDTNPYIYTLGGCIANLIMTIVGIIIMIKWIDNMVVFIYSWSFFVMGTGFLYMNWVPRVRQICNDMACYLLLKKDPLTRSCHNAQLMAAYFLNKKCTYWQIGKDMLCLPVEEAYNDILAYHALLEYYYYLDMGDYERQKQALEKIKDETKLSATTINYLYIEKIYLRIKDKIMKKIQSLADDRDEESVDHDELREIDELDKCINMYYIKGDFHMERVKVIFDVYKELVCGNAASIRKQIIDIINNISKENYIYYGSRYFV